MENIRKIFKNSLKLAIILLWGFLSFTQCNQVNGLLGNDGLEKELQTTQLLALIGVAKPPEIRYENGTGNPDTPPPNNTGSNNSSTAPLTPAPEPLKNIWATLSNLPRSFRYPTTQTIGDKIYLFGNDVYGNLTDGNAYSYNTVTAQWTKLKNMPGPRYGSSSAVVGNKIYVLGGYEYVYQLQYDQAPYCVNQLLWHCFQWYDPPPVYGYTAHARNSLYIYDTLTDTWTTGAPMLDVTNFNSSIAYDGKVYSFYRGKVDVYDPSSNQWNQLLSNSPIYNYYTVQEYNQKFYFFAGTTSTWSFSSVYEFDPTNLTFTQKTNIPTPRIFATSMVLNGKIYVMGGHEGQNARVIEEYTPDTNSWAVKASLPIYGDLNRGVGGYANGRFYGLGGYNNVVVYYDPANDTTTHLKVLMNQARYYFASAIYENKFYVFGGHNGSSSLTWIEALDLTTNSWSKVGELPNGKHGFKAAVLGNKIYLVGGNRGSSTLSEVEIFDPATGNISTGTPIDTPRQHHSLCVNNGKMYAVGGNNGNTILNTVEEFDPVTNKWVYKRAMTTARADSACIFHDEKLYVIGGRMPSTGYTAQVESYNPVSDSWAMHQRMNYARGLFDVVKLRGRIYAIGGYNNGVTNQVEKYDPSLEQWIPEYSMNLSRYGHSAIAPDTNRIIVVGGSDGPNYFNNAEEFY
ncbi:Kelch repeat-containing protein [Leptospira kanakyensis]|nr:kelch repeat-containing protein [Leptospira kanakyensis]